LIPGEIIVIIDEVWRGVWL